MSGALRHADVDSREVDGEVVIWDGTSLHLLDRSSAAVWLLVDGVRFEGEIADLLVEAFVAHAPALRHDVATVLRSLEERGLLVEADQEPGRPK